MFREDPSVLLDIRDVFQYCFALFCWGSPLGPPDWLSLSIIVNLDYHWLKLIIIDYHWLWLIIIDYRKIWIRWITRSLTDNVKSRNASASKKVKQARNSVFGPKIPVFFLQKWREAHLTHLMIYREKKLRNTAFLRKKIRKTVFQGLLWSELFLNQWTPSTPLPRHI